MASAVRTSGSAKVKGPKGREQGGNDLNKWAGRKVITACASSVSSLSRTRLCPGLRKDPLRIPRTRYP